MASHEAPTVPTNKGVRTQGHMYVEYETGERELYDLNADPYQLQSIAPNGQRATLLRPAGSPRRPEGLLGRGLPEPPSGRTTTAAAFVRHHSA